MTSKESLKSSKSSSSSVSSDSMEEPISQDPMNKGVEIVGKKSVAAVVQAIIGSGFTFGWAMAVMNLIEDRLKCWLFFATLEDDDQTIAVEMGNVLYSSLNCELVTEFPEETYQYISDATQSYWAAATGILPLGAVIGALVGGIMSNKLGRKKTMQINAVFLIIISILLALTKVINSMELFLILKLLAGVNVGVSSSAAPVYIGEIAPLSKKGAYGAAFQFGITTGIVVANIMTMKWTMGTAPLWTYTLGINVVPAAIQLFMLFGVPESPAFLLSQGKEKEAVEANILLKGPDSILNKEDKVEDVNIAKNIKEIMKNKPVRKATFVAIMLMVFQQFCGINAIFFYSGSIFKDCGLSADVAQIATVGVSTVNVAFVAVAIAYSDKLGRKKLLNIAFIIQAVCCGLMVLFMNLDGDTWGYLSIVSIVIYVAAFEIGPGPLPWAAGSESIPAKYIAGAQALVVSTNWICACIVAFIFPPISDAIGGWSFIIFCGVCVGAIFYILTFMVETKGRTIDEVQAIYAK